MKKVLSIAMLLAIAVSCLFVFASCGATPNSDPDAAVSALEAAGYEADKMELTSYTIVTGNNSDYSEMVTIQYYESEVAAQAAYDTLEAELAEMEELASELGESVDYEIGISGTMVWAGTPDAISAAK